MWLFYVNGDGRSAHCDYNIYSLIRATGYSQTVFRLMAVPQNDLILMVRSKKAWFIEGPRHLDEGLDARPIEHKPHHCVLRTQSLLLRNPLFRAP